MDRMSLRSMGFLMTAEVRRLFDADWQGIWGNEKAVIAGSLHRNELGGNCRASG
jgi:hypothetical protein